MGKSPVSIPFSTDGVELAVLDGDTLPTDARGQIIVGLDGTTTRFVNVDSLGRVLVVGAGVAGTPAGGVVSVQGVSGGQALPISGTVTATNASTGTTGAAVPGSATLVGGSDGTNLQAARLFDGDTGGGTQYILGVALRKFASGGTVEAGTSSDPLRVDPTGTTTQPVSGTVTANIGTSGSLALDATLTGNNQRTRITDGTNLAAVKAASTAAVAGDPALVVAVSPNNTVAATQSGTWTNAQGTGAGAAAPWSVRLSDGTSFYNSPTASQLPSSLVSGRLDVNLGAWLGSTAPTVGSKTSANSIPVVIASDQGAVPISGTVTASNPSTGTNNAAAPGSSTQIGGTDGTNLQAARVFDADTGGGTQYVLGAILRKAASGGSVEAGTSSDPLRVDPTGTTTQPVSGTVTANIGTSGSLALDATLTGNNQRTRITDGTNIAAVKAASTAAVAGDPALVVAVSPNNTVAVTGAAKTTSGSINGSSQSVTTSDNDGDSGLVVQIAGTWVGTIAFQGNVDGTNWFTVLAKPVSSPTNVATVTANGAWRLAISGLKAFRVLSTAWTSGTANIEIRRSGGATPATEIHVTTLSTANAAAAGLFAGVTSYGYLRAAVEPSALFNDCFEGATLDTVNRWNTPTQASGGTVSLFGGMLTLNITSTSGSRAAADTKAKFGSNTGLGFLAWGCLVQHEATPLVTGRHAFWGLGTVSGSWSASAEPLFNGVGFEITNAGALRTCVYQGGVLVTSTTLTPNTDGGLHRYGLVFRNDTIFWYMDTLEYPAASLQLSYPGFPALSFFGDTSVFPVRFHCISHTSGAPASYAIEVAALGLGDTSHSNQMLSDGLYPWRKARISSGGSLYVRQETGDTSYTIMQQNIATASNKSMISIFNTGTTYNVNVSAIYLVNTQTAAQTGVNCRFSVRRLTGSTPSAGTDIASTAVEKLDSNNPTFSTHVGLRTGATVGTESTIPISSVVWSTEEHVAGSIKDVTYQQIAQYATPLWGRNPGATGLLLRNGEGLTVKCETSTTTGNFDITMVVTLEPV